MKIRMAFKNEIQNERQHNVVVAEENSINTIMMYIA